MVLAYANAVSGNYFACDKIIDDLKEKYNDNFIDSVTISRRNLVQIISQFMQKKYDGMREKLFEAVTFANNTGDNFTKNILKVLLGKMFKDNKQAKHAIEIYNEQITYFAKEKMALGALLTWYLIADATIVTENSKSAIDIATQALEVAQNPNIDNLFFIANLKIVLAKAYISLADYETAKINIEFALSAAKKYKMQDLLSKIYLLYGDYYMDMGSIDSPNRADYLRGSAMMYEKAMEIVVKDTQNSYIKDAVSSQKSRLNDFCQSNGIKL